MRRPLEKTERLKSHDRIVLVGLEAISGAVDAGPKTIKRWVQFNSFPARYCDDGVWRANPQSILKWFDSMVEATVEVSGHETALSSF